MQDAWLAGLQSYLDQPTMLAQTQAGLNNTHLFLPDLGCLCCAFLPSLVYGVFFSMINKNTAFLLA